jgi:hypothetical protein
MSDCLNTNIKYLLVKAKEEAQQIIIGKAAVC